MTGKIKPKRPRTIPGLARKAQIRHCRCGQPILTGLDADQCATTARTDPAILTRPGELAARLHGRATYTLISGELHHREVSWRYTESDTPVIAQHICGQPTPETWKAQMPAPRPARPETLQF